MPWMHPVLQHAYRIFFSLVKYYFVQFSSFPFSIFEEIRMKNFEILELVPKLRPPLCPKQIDFTKYGNEIAHLLSLIFLINLKISLQFGILLVNPCMKILSDWLSSSSESLQTS